MPKQVQKSEAIVRVIEATAKGEFREQVYVGCDTLQHAKDTADRLQREFDEDGDPCRTYVYKSDDPIPVYAGLAAYYPHRTKNFNRQGDPTRRMN